MRMSTEPSVLHVGPAQIASLAGISSDEKKLTAAESKVVEADKMGSVIDTMTLDFGFYVTAQAYGMAVLNSVINHAVKANCTTVYGGATVPASGLGQIPALYAICYSNEQRALSVVITNKGNTAQQVTIRVNGNAASGPIPQQFVSSTDACAKNSSGTQNISIQTTSSSNPITVPPYSVLRADLVSVDPRI